MNQNPKGPNLKSPLDRIEGDTIFLDFDGYFPKKVIIIDHCQKKEKEYRIVKSVSGGFALNKYPRPASHEQASFSQPAECPNKGRLGFLFFRRGLMVTKNEQITPIDQRLKRAYRLCEVFGRQVGDLRMQLGKLRSPSERGNYVRICDLPESDDNSY